MSLPSSFYIGGKQGISFQLKPTGVRYFFASSPNEFYRRMGRGIVNRNPIRDISTQYNSIGRGAFRLRTDQVLDSQRRLIAHAEAFYPEFTMPDDRKDSYAWVAFPMLGAAMKQTGALPPMGVNLQVASGLRAFSIEEMTATVFGEAPRQLQAAVAESLTCRVRDVNIDNLTLGSLLRGYLPPNSMAEVLRMNFDRGGLIQRVDKFSANEIRLLLRRLNSKRIMRLVSGLVEDWQGHMLLRDAARQYADARKNHPDVVMDLSRQFRSFTELHDTITHEYRKLKDPNLEIQYDSELVEKLSDIVLPDGAKLIWPSCSHELVEWSSDKAMNNCIFSYGREAAEGRCLLFAVLDASGKMIINVMVRYGNVVQCYGKANTTCEDGALLKAMFDGFKEAGIINEESDYTRWLGHRW